MKAKFDTTSEMSIHLKSVERTTDHITVDEIETPLVEAEAETEVQMDLAANVGSSSTRSSAYTSTRLYWTSND